jgi:hypothetical protein
LSRPRGTAIVAIMVEREGERSDGVAERLSAIVAQNIKALRGEIRLSGPLLAEEMKKRGVAWNRTTVAKIEAGKRLVGLHEWLALAKVFRVPPVILLADPRRQKAVPVAEGQEVNPWTALAWLTGKKPLTEQRGAEWQTSADVLSSLDHFSKLVESLDPLLVPTPTGDRKQWAKDREQFEDWALTQLVALLEKFETELGAILPPLPDYVIRTAEARKVRQIHRHSGICP